MAKDEKKIKGTVDNGSEALPMVENEIVDEAVDHNGIVGDVTQDGVFIPRDGEEPVEVEEDEVEEDEEVKG